MRSLRLAAILLVVACQQDPTLVNPATFERPGDVAFVCYDTMTRAFAPLEACGTDETRYAPTALVTQTASGEVGTVDLRLDRTLDADVRVPGFTFVRVGEVPSGIVVPPTEPAVTYVANYGSRTVQWMETARFRPDVDTLAGVDQGAVALPDGPTSLVLSPQGDALFVALPQVGAVLPIAILPSRILEQPGMDALVPLVDDPLLVQPPLASATGYGRYCGTGELRRPSATLREPIRLGTEASPEYLLVADDELLVADTALPMIHRFAIGAAGALTALDPIATGVPVERLAVSPVVPSTVAATTEMSRFLYAIDSVDQSVMVIDYMEGSPTFGSVVPVRTGEGYGDRIRLAADARSIGVMTPGYPGAACTDDGTAAPTRLRGVFLTVGLTSGDFVVVDVYDLDAACRGGSCGMARDPEGQLVAIERHRPRVAEIVNGVLTLTGAPTLSFRRSPGQLDPAGQTSAENREPGLSQLASCPSFMQPVWGTAAAPVICAITDPWTSRDERWRATYQGARPGAAGGRGRFAGEVFRAEAGDASFCARGVLGSADVEASALTEDDPEFGYRGDRLVITSPPPASAIDADEACEQYINPEDGTTDFRVASFRIVSARDQSLQLAAEDGVDYDEVFRCFGGALFRYEVRVRRAFFVSGSISGSDHRVVSSADGCRVDVVGQPIDPADPLTFRNSLALAGRLYANPHVAFAISANADGDPIEALGEEDALLSFGLDGTPAPVAVDVGSRGGSARRPALVEQVLYNRYTQKLYALDSNSDGFVEYSLNPLQADHIFE